MTNDLNKELLNNLNLIAKKDSQLNCSGSFIDMTEYQKIMMSFFSYVPMFLGDKQYQKAPTINDIFLATLDSQKTYTVDDYLNYRFDIQQFTDLSKRSSVIKKYSEEEINEKRKYFNLLLGKLILNGYGNIRIKESCQNNRSGFSAVVLSDNTNDSMIYFSCTDFADPRDILYDAGSNVFLRKMIKTVYGVDVFTEQQKAAEKLVKRELASAAKDNYKVNIGGFSLGGSLAEHAYYKNYNSSTKDSYGEMLLFNPLHTEINKEVLTDSGNKIKVYVTEGDIAHRAFNFKDNRMYDEKTTIIPINIDNELTKQGIEKANSNDNFIGQLMNTVVGYTDKKVSEKTGRSLKLLKRFYSNGNPEEQDALIRVALLNRFKFLVPFDVDVNKVNSLQDAEVALSTIHMNDYIEQFKKEAFNENGFVNSGGKDYRIEETLEQIHNVSLDNNLKM